MSLEKDLSDVIAPVVSQNNFRLWDVKVTKASKRSIVSVTLDKAGGASIDDIAQMSKSIAPVLDDHPRLEDAYHLEVATPGLERSLTKAEHYLYSIGEKVTVSYRDESLVRVKGTLLKATDSTITLELDEPTEENTRTIPIDSITKAHTVFDFDQAMKNGPITDIESQDELQEITEGEISQ